MKPLHSAGSVPGTWRRGGDRHHGRPAVGNPHTRNVAALLVPHQATFARVLSKPGDIGGQGLQNADRDRAAADLRLVM
jgi:hypothetical protein